MAKRHKTSFFVYFGGDQHNLLTFFEWTKNTWKMGADAHNRVEIKLEKAMTFRFGNDETLEAKPVVIAGVNRVLRVHVLPWRSTTLVVESFFERPRLSY